MSNEEIDRTSAQPYFVTGALTTAATALGSSLQDLTELVIQASPRNTVTILLGDAGSQGWELEPGDQFNCPIRNPGLLYGKALSSTATYSLFGRKGA